MKVDLNLGHTQLLIAEARKQGLLRNQTAYLLATTYHETGHTMEPVEEAFYLGTRKKNPIKNLDAWRKKNLRYYPWHGRGFIQLTWEFNYFRAEKETGLPITKDPTLAMVPATAAHIAVTGMKEGWFTGKKLSDYITLKKSEYPQARRIINGIDERDLIAGYAVDYDQALRVLNWD